jgi:hypothetical protein
MKIQFSACLGLLTSIFFAAAVNCVSLAATPRSAVSEQIVGRECEGLERRFFPKTYWNDPIDKRLERLELMIYGSTQSGSVGERLDRIKKDVMLRSKTPPAGVVPKTNAGKDSAGNAGDSSSNQYPVLNTLEWRALKKTYPSESLDQRLARLESHLFGQPSATMPYVDRIDRLKRVMGMGLTSEVPNGSLGIGPIPKARPHGLTPFGAMPNWSTTPQQSPFMAPEIGRSYPGLDPDMFGGDGSHKPLAEMMKKMRQQMQEFSKMGPGVWTYDQNTGTFIDRNTGRRFKGGMGKPFTKDESLVPPYLDPNSI